MKKLLVSVLLVIYGLSSTGMSVYVHYCCGKVDKVDFSTGSSMKCPAGNHGLKKGCCDSKAFSMKLNDSYAHATYQLSFHPIQPTHPIYTALVIHPVLENSSHVFYSNSSPPGLYGSNRIILFCSYRI